jgi:PPM family protein phosphatase
VGKGTSLIYSDRTDVGRRRANNQDSKSVLPPSSPQQYQSRGWMFLVADGMGAHAAGEMASGIAAERVPLVYEKSAQHSPPLALRRSIEQTNAEINAKGESAAEFRGMGTTCTVLVLVPRGALVGHIGDSRAYRVRGRTIEQLSRDHSLVWELELSGGMSREQAAEAAPKNIITRSMGPHAHVDVDIEGPFPIEEGDTFVLCSDGLSGQVADEEIGLFAAELEPREATAALTGLALVRGAPDNVTVIAARAGAEEVSKVSASDEPWPLTEEPASPTGRAALPWKWLAVAALGLFVALALSPLGDIASWIKTMLGNDIGGAVGLVGCGAAVLVTLAGATLALLGFLAPTAGNGRVLPPGRQIGKGPYRTYDCLPNERLFERIVASVEAGAAGLSDGDRDRTTAILGRVRRHVAEQAFHEAVVALAEALALYTRAVEQARSGDTIRGPAPADA